MSKLACKLKEKRGKAR